MAAFAGDESCESLSSSPSLAPVQPVQSSAEQKRAVQSTGEQRRAEVSQQLRSAVDVWCRCLVQMFGADAAADAAQMQQQTQHTCSTDAAADALT